MSLKPLGLLVAFGLLAGCAPQNGFHYCLLYTSDAADE